MNVRFAEECRENYMELKGFEGGVQEFYWREGRSNADMLLKCEQDIFLGIFFDGTNNNKYRDTPLFAQSNVARLYEVYPGTPAEQNPLELKQPKNGKRRELYPSKPPYNPPFKTMRTEHNFQYYRKIYVPGVGTGVAFDNSGM